MHIQNYITRKLDASISTNDCSWEKNYFGEKIYLQSLCYNLQQTENNIVFFGIIPIIFVYFLDSNYFFSKGTILAGYFQCISRTQHVIVYRIRSCIDQLPNL